MAGTQSLRYSVPMVKKVTVRKAKAGAGDSEPRRLAPSHAAEPAALAGGLYLVATPIGNLGDITVRALEVLTAADVIACEDTRVTRRLTERYGIATPLTPYHEHNAAEARPRLLARLAAGEAVALVVADSAGAAADAAELVEVGYRELQAIVDPEQALSNGAPQLDDAVPGNLVYEIEAGNEAAVTEAIRAPNSWT